MHLSSKCALDYIVYERDICIIRTPYEGIIMTERGGRLCMEIFCLSHVPYGNCIINEIHLSLITGHNHIIMLMSM